MNQKPLFGKGTFFPYKGEYQVWKTTNLTIFSRTPRKARHLRQQQNQICRPIQRETLRRPAQIRIRMKAHPIQGQILMACGKKTSNFPQSHKKLVQVKEGLIQLQNTSWNKEIKNQNIPGLPTEKTLIQAVIQSSAALVEDQERVIQIPKAWLIFNFRLL